MKFNFWKMHGTGNDFVLTESDDPDADWPNLARRVCDRHFGVGADGLIVAFPSAVAGRRMRIFNPDGSEPEMCGNGIRCFVKYLLDRGSIVAPDGGRQTRSNWSASARSWSMTRSSRTARISRWFACRIARTSTCECGSAVPVSRWRAAPGPARQWSRHDWPGGWTMTWK